MGKYLLIGVGQAGGAVVDEMIGNKAMRNFAQAYAVNSTAKDLMGLRRIPQEFWLGVSERHGLLRAVNEQGQYRKGFEEQLTSGFGKDCQLASEVLGRHVDQVADFFRRTFPDDFELQAGEASTGEWVELDEDDDSEATALGSALPAAHVPFALVVMGLGGGTGAGCAGTLIRALRQASAVHTNVIAVGILPSTGGKSNRGTLRQAWNARWALRDLEKVADGIILVDNEPLSGLGNQESLFPAYNRYISHVLTELIAGPQLDGPKIAQANGELHLPVLDIRDIISAISFGSGHDRRPGYATMARAAEMTHRFAGYLVPGLGRRQVDPAALLRLARMKQTIGGALPARCRKNLALVRVPVPFARGSEGLALMAGVEGELGEIASLGEIHFGMAVTKRKIISISALFTYRPEDLPRIVEINGLASEYDDNMVLEGI